MWVKRNPYNYTVWLRHHGSHRVRPAGITGCSSSPRLTARLDMIAVRINLFPADSDVVFREPVFCLRKPITVPETSLWLASSSDGCDYWMVVTSRYGIWRNDTM
jgi:hypothetical protein